MADPTDEQAAHDEQDEHGRHHHLFHHHERDKEHDAEVGERWLEAFNAEGVVEHPGEPAADDNPEGGVGPSDADAPAPAG